MAHGDVNLPGSYHAASGNLIAKARRSQKAPKGNRFGTLLGVGKIGGPKITSPSATESSLERGVGEKLGCALL